VGNAKLSTYAAKPFFKSLQKLRDKGGRSREAFKEAYAALKLWQIEEDPKLRLTRHGETRIAHAVKYDLEGFHRLVAIEHEGTRILLFVGSHDEVDRWLDKYRGHDFAYDKETGDVAFGSSGLSAAEVQGQQHDLQPVMDRRGPMFDAIPTDDWDNLGLPPEIDRAIRRHATFERCDEPGTYETLDVLRYPSDEVRLAILNAYLNLAQGNPKAAVQCIRQVPKKAVSASDDPEGFRANLASGAASDELVPIERLNLAELNGLLDPARFSEWMLFLAREQAKLVEREFSGPARVVGVSGSGKTCVLVHRANYLAKKYPGERILVLTLGRSLVRLLGQLLDQLCGERDRRQIDVMSIYDYCYRMVKTIEPGRLIEQVDPRSGEDLVRCWRDFLEKPHAQKNVEDLFTALRKRDDPIRSPETYVLEELIWIRSGFGKDDRERYLTVDRPGRGIPLLKWSSDMVAKREYGKMPPDARRRLLDLLKDYEEYMADGGLLDQDGVSLEAFALRKRLAGYPSLRARCVLVDEIQDVSTNELAVLAEIPTQATDGLFLCGDPVQKVFPKQHDLGAANVDIRGRAAVLKRNYRNTRQILTAAFRIIDEFAELASIPESEIIRPEYAYRDGEKPLLYECESRDEQVRLLMSWLGSTRPGHLDATCVCSPRRETLERVVQSCEAQGIQTTWLTGEQLFGEKGVRISELEFVKGYEFATVYILDLSDPDLPAKGTPWEERWRDAFHIYVAMTRARDELSMMFVDNRSILLGPLQDTVEEEEARTVLD